MKPILLPRSSLLLTLIVVACSSTSDRQFTDEACYSDVDPPPWGTLVDLAIFDQNGQPVCAPARVTGQQGREPEFVIPRVPNVYAELFPNGHHGLRWGASCNAYNGAPGGGPEVRGLFRCSDPLNWRVEAEGCEPARGSWSWNDNTFPGRVDISFHVTVRLRCNGVSDGAWVPTRAPMRVPTRVPTLVVTERRGAAHAGRSQESPKLHRSIPAPTA